MRTGQRTEYRSSATPDELARICPQNSPPGWQGGPFELNIPDPAARSHAVTSLRIGAEHGTRLRRWCQDQAGLTLGIGLGMATEADPKSDGFFRFGHMGHVNAQMILGMLATVQTGLRALDIRHGDGALEAAGDVIAAATV